MRCFFDNARGLRYTKDQFNLTEDDLSTFLMCTSYFQIDLCGDENSKIAHGWGTDGEIGHLCVISRVGHVMSVIFDDLMRPVVCCQRVRNVVPVPGERGSTDPFDRWRCGKQMGGHNCGRLGWNSDA